MRKAADSSPWLLRRGWKSSPLRLQASGNETGWAVGGAASADRTHGAIRGCARSLLQRDARDAIAVRVVLAAGLVHREDVALAVGGHMIRERAAVEVGHELPAGRI